MTTDVLKVLTLLSSSMYRMVFGTLNEGGGDLGGEILRILLRLVCAGIKGFNFLVKFHALVQRVLHPTVLANLLYPNETFLILCNFG